MSIKEYLKNNILLTDGAFGTYYATKYGHDDLCERANLENPERVTSIHADYIQAGAKLIRTNTFAANKFLMGSDEILRSRIIKRGYELAVSCAQKEDVYVAADIGPVSSVSESDKEVTVEEKLEEYKAIIDVFLECGADIFVFETMTELKPLDLAVEYLRERSPDSYIICQFAVFPDAHTGNGIGLFELFDQTKQIDADVVGLNCASGPIHLLKHVKKIKNHTNKVISALPNASFPEHEGSRTSYSQNEKYFADISTDIAAQGVRIIGGCCGTTPGHIKKISQELEKGIDADKEKKAVLPKEYQKTLAPDINLIVEVSPPLKAGTKNLVKRINDLKDMGISKITLPDSPLGRARMNPLMVSSLVRSECHVETIAHLCCRDRNTIALRSDILAAWAMGLRHVLCVTGDPVAAGSRDTIKSVFNLTGTGLAELVNNMNAEFFSNDPIEILSAIDFSATNFDVETKRAIKKKEAGATVFVSQPIYTDKALENISRFKSQVDTTVYAGILPPISYRNARFLKNEVPGIKIPDTLIQELRNEPEDNQQTAGVKYAVSIAKKALKYADGIYLMLPFGKISVASEFFKLFND